MVSFFSRQITILFLSVLAATLFSDNSNEHTMSSQLNVITVLRSPRPVYFIYCFVPHERHSRFFVNTRLLVLSSCQILLTTPAVLFLFFYCVRTRARALNHHRCSARPCDGPRLCCVVHTNDSERVEWETYTRAIFFFLLLLFFYCVRARVEQLSSGQLPAKNALRARGRCCEDYPDDTAAP